MFYIFIFFYLFIIYFCFVLFCMSKRPLLRNSLSQRVSLNVCLIEVKMDVGLISLNCLALLGLLGSCIICEYNVPCKAARVVLDVAFLLLLFMTELGSVERNLLFFSFLICSIFPKSLPQIF